MPVRTNQYRAAGEGFQDMAFFDESYISLKTRVKRLDEVTANRKPILRWKPAPPPEAAD